MMVLFLILSILGATDDPFLPPGADAPPFELRILDEKGKISLDDMLEKHDYAFLIFWTTFCPDCLASMANMCDMPAVFDSLGWDFGTVSINYDREDWDFVRDYRDAEKLTFPILDDKKGKIAFDYGTDIYNIGFFLVDKEKKIVWSFPDRPEDPEKAVDTMVDSIRETVFPEELEQKDNTTVEPDTAEVEENTTEE